MRARVTSALTLLLVLPLSASVIFSQQEMAPPEEAPMPQQKALTQAKPAFTQQELDQMLAPIALYPDSLLSQILMASTYPLEIVEAARWSKANPNLNGDQAVQAVKEKLWDPSVKSLVAFPQILTMMDEKLEWTERLGDAFLAQQQQVMDTIQNLRQKASAAGNLSSNDQVRVSQQGQSIVIEPANPQVIYVPYYDPALIYGPWWWPAYPPVVWAPWPGYFIRPGYAVGFVWGAGIPVGPRFFFGAFNWLHRVVNVTVVNNYYVTNNVVSVWQHAPIHRRGVPYRDTALRQQFGRASASPEARFAFRGHDSASFENRGGAGNRPDAREGFGRRPDERDGALGHLNAPIPRSQAMRGVPSRPTVPGAIGRPHVESRPHAFEGIGHGAAVRNFSARGHQSFQGFGLPPSGGFHGSGRGSHHR
jgi:hypothetical protein